ncbi:MAG: transglutaminase-like domain-containing protein [Verrucomicrobiota bacterium]|nr:transglutaminase-like domain-containing protein [Verrucomicrobiota bacterium]
MKFPPLMMGIVLIFWGWSRDQWLVGVAAAIVVETLRFIPFRLQLKESDFRKVFDVTVSLFLIAIVLGFIVLFNRGTPALLHSIRYWSAMVFLPFYLTTLISTQNHAYSRVFFYVLRRYFKQKDLDPQPLPVGIIYFFLVLIVSGQTYPVRPFYPLLFCPIAFMGLFLLRPLKRMTIGWVTLILTGCFMGYGLQWSLHEAHMRIDEAGANVVYWLKNGNFDAYKTSTAIGSIGKIKMSDRIVLRVKPLKNQRPPFLLPTAYYNNYRNGDWIAFKSASRQVDVPANGITWQISDSKDLKDDLMILMYPGKNFETLPAPAGTVRFDNLRVESLALLQLGSFRAKGADLLLRYRVAIVPAFEHAKNPDETDLLIPDEERPGLRQFAKESGLTGRNPTESMALIERLFEGSFKYTKFLESSESGSLFKKPTPVSNFLLKTKNGHCEYFATAAAMLLREAGIPARYVTGYAVQEFNSKDGMFIVRHNHAHAWVQVYIQGKWVPFDPTPSSWTAIETTAVSPWRMLKDKLSDLWLGFNNIRYYGFEDFSPSSLVPYLIALLLIPGVIVYRRIRKTAARIKAQPTATIDSLQTIWQRFEGLLSKQGYVRPHSCAPLQWIRETAPKLGHPIEAEKLLNFTLKYYKLRYGSENERVLESEINQLNALIDSIHIGDKPENQTPHVAH